MRTHVLILSMAVLGATLPDGATAQMLGPQDSLVGAALARLQPGKGIRLHTAGLGRLEGKFASLTDSTVTLGMAPGEMKVALAGIDSLWQRGSATGSGALLGGLTGGILLGGLGVAVCSDYDCSGGQVGAFAVGALVGFAGGAVVGGLIGATIPKWHRRVP